jgi:RHS repeat-associated protein
MNLAQTPFTLYGVELWDLTTATLLFSAYDGVDEFVWDAYPVSDDEVWVWLEADGVPDLALSQNLDLAIFASGFSSNGQPLWFSVVTTPFPESEPSPNISPLFLVDLTADNSAATEPSNAAEVMTTKPTTMVTETSDQPAPMYPPPKLYPSPRPPFRPTWRPPFFGMPRPKPSPSPPSPPPPPDIDNSWFTLLESGAPMPWEGWDFASPFSLVNTSTANLLTVIPVTGFSGRGFPVLFSLYHNSANPKPVSSGGFYKPFLPTPGWSHSFSAYITPVPPGGKWCPQIEQIFLVTDTQRIIAFRVIHDLRSFDGQIVCSGLHTFLSPSGIFAQLSQNPTDKTLTLTRKDQVKLTFRPLNWVARLTSIEEPNGNRIELIYDRWGRLIEVRESSGRKLLLGYDSSSRLASITDPRNKTWRLSYDSYGRLRQITNPLGGTLTFTYPLANSPNRHVLLTITDERGFNWRYIYHDLNDARGAIITSVIHPSTTQAKTYSWCNGYVDATDQDGVTVRYTRDSLGQLSAVTLDPNRRNLTTIITHNSQYQATLVTTPRGKVWRFAFDEQGNLLSITDPLGKVSAFTYDPRNNLLSVTDPKGHRLQIAYDTRNNPTQITDPTGKVWTFVYDAFGQLLSETDPQGHRWQYEYNTQGDLIAINDPLGNRFTFAYDSAGFLLSLTDPLNRTWQLVRDDVGRVTSLIHPDNTARTFAYDAAGNLIRVTDENGKSVWFTYDPRGLLTSVTDPMGRRTSFAYTPAGRLSALTNALGRSITYTYEAGTGRLQRVTFPDGTNRSVTYLPDGLIASVTDGRGRTVSFDYDDAGRLVRLNLPNGTNITYTYDDDGLLTAVTDPTGTTSFTYDARHFLTEERNPRLNGWSLKYTYDDCGNPTALTKNPPPGSKAPSTLLATYFWDAAHRLVQVNHFHLGTHKFFYDAASRLIRVENGNGTVTQYDYTVRDFLRKITHYKSDGTLLAGWVRDAFDNVGQVLRERELHTNRYSDFFYNDAYELTRYTVRKIVGTIDARGNYADDQPLLDESFAYDSVGNRTSKTDNLTGTTINYTYDAFNKLLRAGDEQFAYDANGNLLQRTIGQVVWQYEWDDLDQLVKIIRPDGQIIRFTYDGLGRRVRKEGPNGTFHYLHDGFQVISDGVVEYGWAGSRLLGERWTTGTAAKFWHLTDGRASSRLLLDSDQQIVATFDYKAFGELWQSAGNLPTTRRFVSYGAYEYELESDLYFLAHRYYDPNLARFLSLDPTWFGINWYLYALNDPINLFEWFGLEPEKFNGVITGFGPIDWLLQPLGEVAWNYGYTAGEYDAGKVSGWRVALEGAKFGGWLGYYGVTFGRGFVGRAVGLSVNPIRGFIKIHPPAPDWVTKGVHITVEGVELMVRPDHKGGIVFKPIGLVAKKEVEEAIKYAHKLLRDKEFIKKLLEISLKGRDYLKPINPAKSGEVHFIIKALEKFYRTCP